MKWLASHRTGPHTCAAFAATTAVLMAGSIVPDLFAQPAPAPTFRCAIHLSQLVCIICSDCTLVNGEPQCGGTIIGGVVCWGNKQASCTVTEDGWTAECVNQT